MTEELLNKATNLRCQIDVLRCVKQQADRAHDTLNNNFGNAEKGYKALSELERTVMFHELLSPNEKDEMFALKVKLFGLFANAIDRDLRWNEKEFNEL